MPDAKPNPLFDISGKTALVTGSSRGLGRAIAEGLGDAGARLVINGRKAETVKRAADEMRAKGYEVLEAVFDVAVEEEVEGAFEVPDFQRETARRRGRARIGICKRDRLPGIVRGDRHRARTSLASRRYASAPELLDAKDVIGSPATAASGNFTVR